MTVTETRGRGQRGRPDPDAAGGSTWRSPTGSGATTRRALRDVSFQIGRREIVRPGRRGPGSGKSTVALALTRYLPRNRPGDRRAGISINGQDPLAMDAEALRALRARTVSMVVPGTGQGAEPVDPGRPPGRRGVRGRGAGPVGGAGQGPRPMAAHGPRLSDPGAG